MPGEKQVVGKNKALTKSLEERGLMTDFGRRKIEEARKNGQWDAPKPGVTEEQIAWMMDRLNKNLKPM